MTNPVRIGCGTGFWGDSPEGAAQLVRAGNIDYLILDYLAEITMSILARMKAKNPDLGYATDFVTHVAKPLAREIAAKGIRVVTNAGGLNPAACRDALERVFAEAGVTLKVAIVSGDDLSDDLDALRDGSVTEMATGASLPDRIASINAYLGGGPIAMALAEGADVVVTGRVVDSALALGPLMHEFGWKTDDYDLLAAGSLAGHVIECGPQATGGIFTDWRDVAGWDDMGFPIAVCHPDGSFEVTKPAGTGGRVSPMTVAEQITYEIGDPAAYILPDVVCDFSAVQVAQIGPDRVRVSGARGSAPTPTYKVCATYADGYRAVATMTISGRDAGAKAQAVADAILARTARLIAGAGFAPFDDTKVEVLGAESSYGADPRRHPSREVVLRIAVRHADKGAIDTFAREIYPAASSMAQGITGFAGGRPAPQPVIRLFSGLVAKDRVTVRVDIEGRQIDVAAPMGAERAEPVPAGTVEEGGTPKEVVSLPLLAIAHGRSGDKGNLSNIAVLARDPDFVPVIRREVTADRVKAHFSHVAKGRVERFDWPGLNGFNFVLHDSLGGGGVASLHNDPQGKGYAQILLDMPVAVPLALLDKHSFLADWSKDHDRRQEGVR